VINQTHLGDDMLVESYLGANDLGYSTVTKSISGLVYIEEGGTKERARSTRRTSFSKIDGRSCLFFDLADELAFVDSIVSRKNVVPFTHKRSIVIRESCTERFEHLFVLSSSAILGCNADERKTHQA
jgi:hypothetical protein